jgi:putative ABC transport system ATP-binding protein
VVDEETYDRLRREDEQRLDALIGGHVEVDA